MRFRWVAEGEHVVQIELGLLTSRETVWVDGAVAYDELSMRMFNSIPVVVGGKSGSVQVGIGWNLMPRVKLLIEGQAVQPWPKGKPLPGPDAGVQVPPLPHPRWMWFFVIACAIIPAVTAGGALPAVLGLGGAAACRAIGKREDWGAAIRVAACSGVTVGCWAMLGILVWVLRR